MKPLFEAHCGKKIKYGSEEKARKIARNLFRNKGRFLDVYACRYGDHWHLGKPQPRGMIDFIRGIKVKVEKGA